MSYKSNTNDGVKLLTLPGLETIQNKTGDIAAGLRKLRPFVLLNGTKLKGRWYTILLIESQNNRRMHQNHWTCFRSQNEIVSPVTEPTIKAPPKSIVKSRPTEQWQCFMPSGGSGYKRRRNVPFVYYDICLKAMMFTATKMPNEWGFW